MTPIVIRIRENLLTLLGGITRINGYEVDADVEVADSRGNTLRGTGDDGAYKTIIGDGPTTDISSNRSMVPLGHSGYWKQFDLYLVTSATQDSVAPADSRLDQFEMSVRFCIEKNRNYTLGGMVRDYKFDPVMPADFGAQKLPCRVLPVKFLYHTLRGNPYQQ